MKPLVLLMIALASVLPLGLSAAHRATAVEEPCTVSASQPEAQAFLAPNPSTGNSPDPNGNEIACGGLFTAGATAVALAPLGTPPSAAPAAASPVAATTTAEATGVAEGIVAPDALDGRLGGTREAFEILYGPALAAKGATQDPNDARYKLSGFQVARVIYQDDRIMLIILLPERIIGTPPDQSAVVNWSVQTADELTKRFLPTDVQPGQERRKGNVVLVPYQSRALAAALTTAAYEQFGRGGEPGDGYYFFFLNGEDQVSKIFVMVGSSKRNTTVSPPVATPAAAVGE